MAVEPIGTGISGAAQGFSGGYRGFGGISVFRKNTAGNMGTETSPIDRSGKNSPGGSGNRSDGYSRISDETDRKRRFDSFECQTCQNRKYQDGSDDSGVSFQTPTRVDPKAAGAAVRSHEQEHVSRNQAKADREGKEIVSQSVTIHTGICPECGKVFVSGGTTKTVTRSGNDSDRYGVGLFDPTEGRGGVLNKTA